MHQINIEQIDLNLLLVLKILLEERSVTKAGERLNLSQSATSHALRRLRLVFNDQLLTRSPKGMMPTPRAIAISESLETTSVILPSVLEQLSRKSPNINIECFD